MGDLIKLFFLSASIAFGIYWGTHTREVNRNLIAIISFIYRPVIILLIILVILILFIVVPEKFRPVLTIFTIFGVVGIIREMPLYQRYRMTRFHSTLKKYTSDIKFTPKVVLFICVAVFGIPIILGLLIGFVDRLFD